MSIADSIANLIIQQGSIRANQAQAIAAAQARAQELNAQAAANAQIAGGQIWGQTIQNLGQLPMQVSGQIQQQKAQALENQQRQLQIQRAQQVMQGEKAGQGIWSQIAQPDGSLDATGLMKNPAFAQMLPEQQQAFVKQVDDYNTIHQKFTQQRTDHAAQIADSALKTAQASGEPLSVLGASLWLNTAANSGIATPDEVKRMQQALVAGADPTKLFQAVRNQGSQFKAKPITNETEAAMAAADPTNPQQAVAAGAMKTLKPPPQITEAGLAKDAADDSSPTQAMSKAALALLKPPKLEGAVTGPEEDARYEKIQQAITLKQPVSPEDAAWASAYEKRKTIGPEASAAAASSRLASEQANANTLAQNKQLFEQQQAGRSELTNKIEQPYQDAREKAATLRSVVDAAKGGNMEAAAVQSLLATLGLTTMEGVKRINGTELAQVSGAGSLWESIKARASKLTAGQPLTPKLQDDIVDLANRLEQAAYTKYKSGFDTVTKRYQLTDETALPGPGGGGGTGNPALDALRKKYNY